MKGFLSIFKEEVSEKKNELTHIKHITQVVSKCRWRDEETESLD